MFDEYLALIHTFPLISIRDDAHLAAALDVIDGLLEQPQRSAAEELYLGAENGLTQADLVPLLGTPSIVSEVLSGKRRLALGHIKRLAAYFGLPADVFIGSPRA